jgi:hypothetical protein
VKHGKARQSTVEHVKHQFFQFCAVPAQNQSGGCPRVTNSKGSTTCLKVAGFSKVASPLKGLDETIGLMP